MARRASIVVTTIFEPHFISGYVENLRSHGRLAEADLIVICDRKTPQSVGAACAQARAEGLAVTCPTLDEQDAFLRRFPEIGGRIPYDSDNRRNIGFLMALDQGADVLISIDDDNYSVAGVDFVGEHLVAGTEVVLPEIVSENGWYNIASRLHGTPQVAIYPRGFPYAARGREAGGSAGSAVKRRVAINAGLWTSDPDVDAVTRLAVAPRIESANSESVLLAPNTWSPLNTQNTSLSREAIAAYYYIRMGHKLGGMTIDRYGDILSGYFVQKCAKSLGEAVRIGAPIADHRRTPHNLFKDLYHELAGMVIVEDLLPWLRELPLNGRDYPTLYLELADRLTEQAPRFKGFVWDQGARDFLEATAESMRAWISAVRVIGI